MGTERDKDIRQLFLAQPVLNTLLQRGWPLTSRKIAFPPRPKKGIFCAWMSRCTAAHSHITSNKRYFPVFMKKALQCSWLRLFLSFWEDVLGVTNIKQGIQSCQTQEPPSTLGHSSAAHE